MLDLNDDKIGDSPFENTSSLSTLVEENELAYLFLDSPAITIYEKTNELLSNDRVMAMDKYPLMSKEKQIKPIVIFISIIIAGTLIFLYRKGKLPWLTFGKKD